MISLLLAAALPTLLWDRGPDTAESLRAASIPCIAASTAVAKTWSGSNFCVTVMPAEELEKAAPPGTKWGVRDIGTASATRAPWVNSNAWRFLLRPDGKYLYELPKGAAALAAAEAFTYEANAWLRVEPDDLKPVGDILTFLKQFENASDLKPATNIAVINNGSRFLPEALNLLARRNLLFRVVRDPDPSADLNLRIGSPEFPEAEAANPVAVADKARKLLTDRKRLLRIYGSEVVLGRLYEGGDRARVHLLNYGSEKAEEVRVRVRGTHKDVRLAVFGQADTKAEDIVVQDGATEFTVPEISVYAVVDLQSR